MVTLTECLASQPVEMSVGSLSAMLAKETTTYERGDYLGRRCSSCLPPNVLSPDDRTAMCDWIFVSCFICYHTFLTETSFRAQKLKTLCLASTPHSFKSIVDGCEISRDVALSTIEISDRFLSRSRHSHRAKFPADRKLYQLMVLASFYIVVKISERALLSSESIAGLSHGVYTKQDIEEMELLILTTLKWNVNGPTSTQLALYTLSIVYQTTTTRLDDSFWRALLEEVNYQCEFSIRHYDLAISRPSTITLAAIVGALDMIGMMDDTVLTMDGYADLLGIISTLMHSIPGLDSLEAILEAKNEMQRLIDEENDFCAAATKDDDVDSMQTVNAGELEEYEDKIIESSSSTIGQTDRRCVSYPSSPESLGSQSAPPNLCIDDDDEVETARKAVARRYSSVDRCAISTIRRASGIDFCGACAM